MSKTDRQVAANLAAALRSGNTQDAVSALADYDELGVTLQPDNGPIKAPLAEEEAVEEEAAEEEEEDA